MQNPIPLRMIHHLLDCRKGIKNDEMKNGMNIINGAAEIITVTSITVAALPMFLLKKF